MLTFVSNDVQRVKTEATLITIPEQIKEYVESKLDANEKSGVIPLVLLDIYDSSKVIIHGLNIYVTDCKVAAAIVGNIYEQLTYLMIVENKILPNPVIKCNVPIAIIGAPSENKTGYSCIEKDADVFEQQNQQLIIEQQRTEAVPNVALQQMQCGMAYCKQPF